MKQRTLTNPKNSNLVTPFKDATSTLEQRLIAEHGKRGYGQLRDRLMATTRSRKPSRARNR